MVNMRFNELGVIQLAMNVSNILGFSEISKFLLHNYSRKQKNPICLFSFCIILCETFVKAYIYNKPCYPRCNMQSSSILVVAI